METQTIEEIKKVIMDQLPKLMETDPDIRSFILNVTRESYPDKKETESRFDRKHDSTIGALGARWGLHSESAFRRGRLG